jgi:phage shock protein C
MKDDPREQAGADRSSARDPDAAGGRAEPGEFRQASRRLESAIDDLVSSASGAVNQRASRLVDELENAAQRLREQTTSEPDPAPREHRRGRRRHRRHGRIDSSRAGKHNGWLRDLYREPGRGWIAGVCAGLARYYQVEPWVARVVAFSLLIFIPQIAFWAYIIAIFMLARRPSQAELADIQTRIHAGSSPAPELGPRLAPRHDVRAVRVRFRDLEHRLRRLEGHVTSREFTLAREFSELEREGGDRPASG